MKKQKGFTLVELLAVIVVIGILIAIAVPAYGRISKNVNEKQYQNKLELIKVAALKYADDTNYTAFYIDDLVTNGYMDADQGEKVIDNRDNKTIMNCYLITIVEDAELNYANIEEKSYVDDSGSCKFNLPNDMNNFLTIKMIDTETNEEITWKEDSGYWTKNNVNLNLIVKGIQGVTPNENEYTIKWIEGLSETNNTTSIYNVETDSVLQQNYTARVTMKDSGKTYATTVRVYIDKISPKFYVKSNDNINNKWSKEAKYNIQAYDDESGLYSYQMIEVSEVLKDSEICPDICPNNKNDFNTKRNYQISENGMYCVCLIDNVGNTSNSGKPIAFEKIDNIKPTCDISVIENADKQVNVSGKVWYFQNPTIKIDYEDTYLGINGNTISSSTNEYEQNLNVVLKINNQTVNNPTDSELTRTINKTTNITLKVTDEAGNANSCKATFNVDTTPPGVSFSPNGNGTYSKTAWSKIEVTDSDSGVNNSSLKYQWTNSSSAPVQNSFSTSFTNNATVTKSSESGTYYLWVLAKDNVGNLTIKNSGGFNLDNTAPTISVTPDTSSYTKSTNVTITASDAHSGLSSNNTYQYYLSNNGNLLLGGSWVNYTNGSQVTIGTNKTGTYYLFVRQVKDNVGNLSTGGTIVTISGVKYHRFGPYYFDNTAPTIAVSVSNGTTYAMSKKAKITLSDAGGAGLKAGTYTIKYAWGTSSVACNSMTLSTSITVVDGNTEGTASVTISSGTGKGKIYVCNSSAVTDKANNSLTASTVKSANMYLDNTSPTCGDYTTSWTNSTAKKKVTIKCSDKNSGCAEEEFSKNFQATSTETCINSGTITIKDNVGNTTDCTVNPKIDIAAPTVSCTGVIVDSNNSICSKEDLKYYYSCTYNDTCSNLSSRTISWGGDEDRKVNSNGGLDYDFNSSLGKASFTDTLCMRSSSSQNPSLSGKVCDNAGNCKTYAK